MNFLRVPVLLLIGLSLISMLFRFRSSGNSEVPQVAALSSSEASGNVKADWLKRDILREKKGFRCSISELGHRICSFSSICWFPMEKKWKLHSRSFKSRNYTTPKLYDKDVELVEEDYPPKGCRVEIDGSTVLIDPYQDHIPHFAEAVFAISDLLLYPLGVGSPKMDHLLINIDLHTDPANPHLWIYGLLSLFFPQWKEFTLQKEDPVRGESLLKVTDQKKWPGRKIGCEGEAKTFTVCFENLWGRGLWLWFFSVHSSVMARAKAYEKFGFRGSLDHVCILNRKSNRRIVNVGDVIEWFEKKDETVALLSMEGLSFEEQLRSVSKCKLVVTPHGAQMTNLAFLPIGASVVELVPFGYLPDGYFGSLFKTCGVQSLRIDSEKKDCSIGDSPCWKESKWANFSAQDCQKDMGSDGCHWCSKTLSMSLNLANVGERIQRLLYDANARAKAQW